MSDLSAPTVLRCRHCPKVFPGTWPAADEAWLAHCQEWHPDAPYGPPIGRDGSDPAPAFRGPTPVALAAEQAQLRARLERAERTLNRGCRIWRWWR